MRPSPVVAWAIAEDLSLDHLTALVAAIESKSPTTYNMIHNYYIKKEIPLPERPLLVAARLDAREIADFVFKYFSALNVGSFCQYLTNIGQ
jgi:hypothetical protein